MLYKQFKLSSGYEYYLDIVNIRKYRNALATFRSGSLGLEIERGRYLSIPRQERFRNVFAKHKTEDEYHFLFLCDKYKDIRHKFIPTKFYAALNKHTFSILMACKCEKYITALANYVYYAFERRKLMLIKLESGFCIFPSILYH